ncbi:MULTISPECIES: MMPL family transporter [unclassified Streptomyces]|uniref:MMPL family transporter n=1 Tax=unclassified Streptomyces TaxID=2593676 RepID=UPI002E293F15|nr:MMPL family transporter [Streptomyces sp. NBC_00223]
MLDRWARLIIRKPRAVVLVTLLLVFMAGGAAGGLQKHLTMGGYESSTTASSKAADALQKVFKQGEPNLVMVVTAPGGVDSATAEAAGARLADKVAAEAHVTNVTSYWTAGHAAALRSKDGNQALILGRITGDFDDAIDRVKTVDSHYHGTVDGLQVKVGGSAMMWKENTSQSAKDATKADGTVFPLVLIVLMIVFGSAVAALLPLSVAISAMLLSMGVLFGLTFAVDTSNVVVNTTTFLGIGLGIDYSLLFVSRYREELRRGRDVDDALRRTMRTAGRTALFSALTVAVAFLGLLVLPFTMFTSLAIGCVTTSLLAALCTVVLVPALLKWLGPRVDKGRLSRRRAEASLDGSKFWHGVAGGVMRRPVGAALLAVIVVVVLGLPAFQMKLRLPDESVLPASSQSAAVAKVLATNFDTHEQQALQAVALNTGGASADAVGDYAQRLSALPDVARVDASTGSYAKGRLVAPATDANARFTSGRATYLSIVPTVDPYSDQGKRLVSHVRGTKAPFQVIVGGMAATSVDTFHTLAHRLPIAAAILFVGMFVLLFLLTGSVLLPIKAMVLTGCSLTATFGALVFIFQQGHLKGLVGDFIVTGGITWTVPVLIFGVAFALSMDYEVFMLARIKEEYDRTGDNEQAVVAGLGRVGKIITYAALLLSIVFLVLVTSGISYMKAIGVGLPLAILMDATLIRGVLLPALMKLMGRANWWAPKPLRALHQKFGLHESDGPDSFEPAAAQGAAPAPAARAQSSLR